MREAHPPQTTFYPCRHFPAEHLIRHAHVAPRERRGESPLLTIGPRREPRLLPSGPPQPSLAAIPSGFLNTHGAFKGSTVRQDTCLDKPPQGNQQLSRQSDHPYPTESATPVAKALLIPLRERTLWLKAQPSPGNLNSHRADMIVAGFGDATLVDGRRAQHQV
jgi:hypothetical protein